MRKSTATLKANGSWLAILLLSLAQPLLAEDTNGVLQGEVFIVTKSAVNVRLGLVEVMLFSNSDITNHVANRNKRIKEEMPDFDKKIGILNKDISLFKATLEELGRSPITEETIALFEKFEKSALKAKESWPASSHYHYFKDFPNTNALASARTDSDGKFSLAMPRHGKFAIAAHASRKLYDSNEEYYWLVWVSLDGKDSKSIVLGNHNTMSSGAKESIVSTKSD